MNLSKTWLIIIALCFTISLSYCSKSADTINNPASSAEKQPVLPATALNYNISYPAYLQLAMAQNDNTPFTNPITNDGATLGRVLFYDKHLSQNNTINCGSCHKAEASFNDNVAFSKGFAGGLTSRSSMALLNVRFYKSGKMFWDERSLTLEDQVLQPIQNHVEMGLPIQEMVSKLSAINYYPSLFQKAFGSTAIDSQKIARALAQFVRSIVPYQSKYDMVKQGLAAFTPAEQQGENLFLNAGAPGTCASCHKPPLFVNSDPRPGFGLLDPNDRGVNNSGNFKVGSLRNIAANPPYFHNGSVASLEAMFTSNIPAHRVAPQDVQNLLAFMQTLTDNQIATEPRFSDPFK
ncbi:MAG: cytochrome c peroxidase [Ferruginibacter sp.]